MTLTPAYGRDYKSRAAIITDLKAGKDFAYSAFGAGVRARPINLPQILETGVASISVRYAGSRKVAVIKRSELE